MNKVYPREYLNDLKRKWYAANRDREREKRRAYYHANIEVQREQVRKWQIANPEKRKENDRRQRAKNPEKRREQNRIWRRNHPIEVKNNAWVSAGIACTVDLYDQLKNRQQNKCAICSKELKLFVDHNHITGKVRGLLCRHCNLGLGHFSDSGELFLKAANYIKEN